MPPECTARHANVSLYFRHENDIIAAGRTRQCSQDKIGLLKNWSNQIQLFSRALIHCRVNQCRRRPFRDALCLGGGEAPDILEHDHDFDAEDQR